MFYKMLLMILQRYTFGSKSQHHCRECSASNVAYDIAKIYIWKQITTQAHKVSQVIRCLWYCKDIHLEANHNIIHKAIFIFMVAYDIAKIYIWKQITTIARVSIWDRMLLMILQRYTFGSKSQLSLVIFEKIVVVYDIAKIGNFSQIATP